MLSAFAGVFHMQEIIIEELKYKAGFLSAISKARAVFYPLGRNPQHGVFFIACGDEQDKSQNSQGDENNFLQCDPDCLINCELDPTNLFDMHQPSCPPPG